MIFDSFLNLSIEESVALSIGVFDGVHLGHRRVLQVLVLEAHHISGKSVVITFKNHPKGFIKKTSLKFIQPLEERLDTFSQLGVDSVIALQFDEAFQKLSASEFLYLCCSKMNLKTLILGHDTTIGSDIVSDLTEIQKILPEVQLIKVPPLKMDGVIISSQNIRKALENGDIETAHRWLGR
jgi:riboflavin kinase/FMN adenylyltransferase